MANTTAKQSFDRIANDLTSLFKQEIAKQKLINTGKLYDSIRFIVLTTPNGYTLQMEAMDYFSVLDEKYNITRNVFASTQYKNIQERIGEATNLMLIEDLTKI